MGKAMLNSVKIENFLEKLTTNYDKFTIFNCVIFVN